jgi:predicted dehydrogenase
MRTLRAGIVGLGVGERHLASYAAIPGVEVAAICDVDRAKLDDVGDRHGVGRRSTDHRAITEADDIDIVSICSYDDAHAEQAISAFRHGKHVMIEKPVVLHRHEAEAVLEAQQASGCRISSNLILRASPRFREVRQLVQDGAMGEIVHLQGDYLHQILWKLTEGWRGRMPFYCVAYGGGIHLVDLMRWILGQEVEEVAAMGNQILTRDSQFRYPDTIVSLLRFERGAIARSTTTLGPQRPQLHALELHGTKMTFVNDVPDGRLWSSDDPASEQKVTSAYPGMEKGDLLPEFVSAIREDREPEVGAVDVFRVMDVCFAIWESVQQARTVKVSYLL